MVEAIAKGIAIERLQWERRRGWPAISSLLLGLIAMISLVEMQRGALDAGICFIIAVVGMMILARMP